ncbi:hypothetical protein [Chondrinema litorale]|uniref:hypothetical protein n=1 Tax=Chondrinema litorale TaxID=2994555 RepID=UPI002542AA2C|nr:hypothetical protein [Chondrinema litorale]UZR99744.1 hypothetical protein OQ292_37710 [Chondrinema litorale]
MKPNYKIIADDKDRFESTTKFELMLKKIKNEVKQKYALQLSAETNIFKYSFIKNVYRN